MTQDSSEKIENKDNLVSFVDKLIGKDSPELELELPIIASESS